MERLEPVGLIDGLNDLNAQKCLLGVKTQISLNQVGDFGPLQRRRQRVKVDQIRAMMRKQASSTAENLVSIRVPKKLAGKKVVLVDAAEYAALKPRLTEVSDALQKISRGDAAYRQGRTKSVSSLSELGR